MVVNVLRYMYLRDYVGNWTEMLITMQVNSSLTYAPSQECVTDIFEILFLNQNICCGYLKEPSQ